ncbi:MAG: hypothetical protein IJ001_12420 [Oscillospiraceae bacterium]|nr:hypothetical protein [Oscillospiraceae bacterium]MBQ8835708.1 hypothetical protein [Oscillospiraceae bacterium]
MLHADHPKIRELLLRGNFGLEKESLRVDEEGFLSHTSHPFPNDDHIVRDFCENQTEINTPVAHSAAEAVAALVKYDHQIQRTIKRLPKREYLWPFSNPPYIRNEEDIPVARFYGEQADKTAYREYLSDRYGRYKMAFSGIHVNYSFDETLLREDFALSGEGDFTEYKNQLYVALAEKAAAYGWLLVAVTAASPLLDSSFVEKGKFDANTFNGLASTRCSELGYWNYFAPIFDYTNIRAYADSIQRYVDDGLLRFPTELYYPIRLKPRGVNKLSTLREQGVDHIELRMFDLNPLVPSGIEERDLVFAQLFLVWLAATPREPLSTKDQVQAVQNFKNAAHYDLKTVKIVPPNGEVCSVTDAALSVLERMSAFYRDFPEDVQEVLAFEREKFIDGDNRYAWKIRQAYDGGFVKKGLELAWQRQEEADV